jgi:hypothetical protein
MADVLTYLPEVVIESAIDYSDLNIPVELQDKSMSPENKAEVAIFLIELFFEML